jgi:phage recombination protein Bet
MAEQNKWSDQTKTLVFNTVAKGLSAADQALFEAVCLSSGLDPLRKEIYAVVRGGKMAIQTGIDGYLKLANQTKELNGMEVLFYDEDGNPSEFWLKKTPPLACLVRVYRKGADYPFTASCRFDAYSQNNPMWKKFPETMLAKATTTLALRRGFADVIAGIASADEMDQAGLADPGALAQGTPALAPKASPEVAPTPAVAQVAPTPAVAQVAPKPAPAAASDGPSEVTEESFREAALAKDIHTVAIDALVNIVNSKLGGDWSKGLATLAKKTAVELNAQYGPAIQSEEGSQW